MPEDGAGLTGRRTGITGIIAAGLGLGLALAHVGSATGAAQPPRPQAPVGVAAAAATPGNPLAARPLYVDADSRPAAQAERWRASRPEDAAALDRIAREPQVVWLGGWYPDIRAATAETMRKARAAGQMPVFVAYHIPSRDCATGSGARSAAAYRTWIAAVAAGIGSAPAGVILEPDALASITCLTPKRQRERTALLRWATARLARQPATAVYIDAGHATWVPVGEMARRLRQAGVAMGRGFALNVANFNTTEVNRRYGRALSARTGGARFVVDTGRNGRGPKPGDWCNPAGRGLGAAPTVATGDPLMDAGLWVKAPGESDGTCNGGPGGGVFWPEYAVGLVRRAPAAG